MPARCTPGKNHLDLGGKKHKQLKNETEHLNWTGTRDLDMKSVVHNKCNQATAQAGLLQRSMQQAISALKGQATNSSTNTSFH